MSRELVRDYDVRAAARSARRKAVSEYMEANLGKYDLSADREITIFKVDEATEAG